MASKIRPAHVLIWHRVDILAGLRFHTSDPSDWTRCVTVTGQSLKEMIHEFGSLGKGRPDLVSVNALGDGCAAVAHQACDVFKVDVVGATGREQCSNHAE